MEIVAKENMVTTVDHLNGWKKEEFADDPMDIPRRIMEKWKPQLIHELPDVFCGNFWKSWHYKIFSHVNMK